MPEAALLSRAPRIHAATAAAAGRSPTECRSPLPRHAWQAVVVGVRVTLTMVHPLWLARRPPSGCRLPLCRRLLPALAAASPWRRALPARPGRPGSLAESLPPLARSLAGSGPGVWGARGRRAEGPRAEPGKRGRASPQPAAGKGLARQEGYWGLRGDPCRVSGITGRQPWPRQRNAWLPKGTQESAPKCPPAVPSSYSAAPGRSAGWSQAGPAPTWGQRSGVTHTGDVHTPGRGPRHTHTRDTRTTTASPRGAWQPLPVLDGLPAAAGGKARFLGRAPLNRADTAAIGRVEVSCQATARELPAASEGVRGVTEAEGQTLACLADGHRSPGRPGHRPW